MYLSFTPLSYLTAINEACTDLTVFSTHLFLLSSTPEQKVTVDHAGFTAEVKIVRYDGSNFRPILGTKMYLAILCVTSL